jgi:hypothetical protein
MSSRDVLGGLPILRQTLRSLLPNGVPPKGQIHVLLVNAAASVHVRTFQPPGTEKNPLLLGLEPSASARSRTVHVSAGSTTAGTPRGD